MCSEHLMDRDPERRQAGCSPEQHLSALTVFWTVCLRSRGRPWGQSPLWPGDTAAHPRAWLHCHLAGEHFLGQPKVKGECATSGRSRWHNSHLSEPVLLQKPMPKMPSANTAAHKRNRVPTAGPGAGWEHQEGRCHRLEQGEACGFGRIAGSVVPLPLPRGQASQAKVQAAWRKAQNLLACFS